ncbi:PAS domain S-box protein, partial [bacterium]|nr:PAS domain S-box protein [bacterium]
MAQIRQKENRFTYALTFIFVVTCLGIVAGSILLYRFENARLITDNSIELTAIVKLKAKQISDYRSERFSEANFVFENASFMSDVTTYRSNPRSLQNQAQLDNWLLPILKNHNYEAISIIDTNGVIFYGIGNYDTKRIKETFRFGKQSLMENKINIGNLILYHADSTYHLEIFVPLIRTTSSSSEKIGVVNFTIDPTIELFELMQSWPIESRTAEVLVIRKEGDQVIYQNELRFKKNTALKLAFSFDTNNLIAVRAVQGETGVQTGTDYRGHEVLFTAKRVPNSDWFVVAKIDTNEVFEVLTTVASLIFSLMTALLLATGTAFFIVLRGHRMKQLKIEIQSVDAVKRLNRVYQVLSNVNQAIVRINDRGELLNEICRIANDDGGFRLCWVGFVNEETGLIEPFSKAGAASSYLKYITVSTNGSIPAGQGPVGKAFQTGKPVVFNNIWTQFQLAPWKENAIKYRLRSAAAFPLKGSSGPIGAIGFYSDQFNFFTIEEVKLLEELSADLSYALLNIEREESSKIAEQALLESEDRYRDLVENSLDIICTHDMNGKILSLNKRGAQLLDYAQDDLLQKNLRDILAPEIRKEFDVYLSEIKQHGSARGNMLVQTSSGKKRVWEYYNTLRTEGVSSPIVRGTAQDITERKRAETALRESENIFKKLFEESTDPILLLDDTGFIDFNNSAVSILGYNSKEELFNKKPWELSPEKQPDGRLSSEKAEAMIKKALDQGYNRFEWIHSKSDGTVFPVEVMLTSIMIKGKQSYYTVWRDISERKRIEVELRESEMRYRSVSQSANDAIITINSHGKVLNWNSGAEKIFGYTEAEIIEAGLAKIIPQRYGDQHIKGMKRVAQGGESRILGKTVELFGIHKNGKEFPIELSIAGWETPSGKCYTGIIRDITARRHAEQTLLLQSSALNAAANGIVITNSDGVIEWVNPAFSSLTGYSIEEAIGKNPRDLVKSGVHDQAYYKHMWDTILEGKIWHGEITNRRKNGTFYIEEQIITPLKNEQGKITHFIAVKQDITERKKAEEALRDSIERFQLISRATNDAVWDWDITTDKTWWNDRFYSLFGFAHDDEHTSLKNWAAKIHPDDRERVLEHFRDALNGISQGWADEFRYQFADGSYGFIYDRAFIIRDDSGKALRMIGSMIDMTLFKKAEQKLQQSENRLRTIVEAEPECVKTLASNGTLLSMNAAGLRMIEAENADQVIGKSVYGLIDPTDRDAFKQLLKNVFDGLSGSLQFQIIGLKGNRRWLDTHAVPLRDENGNINSMLGVTRDVTERRNAEENLKENEAKLKVILESTADGILAVDLEGAVIMANPRFFEMWQIPDSIQESKDDRVLLDFVLEQLVDPEAFLTKVKMLYGSNDHSMDTLNFKDGRVFERLSAPLLSGTTSLGRLWSFR